MRGGWLLVMFAKMSVTALKQGFEMPCKIGLGLAALGRPGYINLDRAKDLSGERASAVHNSIWNRFDQE